MSLSFGGQDNTYVYCTGTVCDCFCFLLGICYMLTVCTAWGFGLDSDSCLLSDVLYGVALLFLIRWDMRLGMLRSCDKAAAILGRL